MFQEFGYTNTQETGKNWLHILHSKRQAGSPHRQSIFVQKEGVGAEFAQRKQSKTTCIILGTFGFQLGYHPTWVLNAPQATTGSLRPYSASTLAKSASRFLTAVNNLNSLVVECEKSIQQILYIKTRFNIIFAADVLIINRCVFSRI